MSRRPSPSSPSRPSRAFSAGPLTAPWGEDVALAGQPPAAGLHSWSLLGGANTTAKKPFLGCSFGSSPLGACVGRASSEFDGPIGTSLPSSWSFGDAGLGDISHELVMMRLSGSPRCVPHPRSNTGGSPPASPRDLLSPVTPTSLSAALSLAVAHVDDDTGYELEKPVRPPASLLGPAAFGAVPQRVGGGPGEEARRSSTEAQPLCLQPRRLPQHQQQSTLEYTLAAQLDTAEKEIRTLRQRLAVEELLKQRAQIAVAELRQRLVIVEQAVHLGREPSMQEDDLDAWLPGAESDAELPVDPPSKSRLDGPGLRAVHSSGGHNVVNDIAMQELCWLSAERQDQLRQLLATSSHKAATCPAAQANPLYADAAGKGSSLRGSIGHWQVSSAGG